MEKIGYKRGILVGLLTCAAGALLFIPAASVRLYGFFLFALFVMACGQGVLEVAANPYVTILGPPESSEHRLNLAQSFNTVGAVITPFVGAAFILTGVDYTRTQLAAMTPAQLQAYEIAEAATVKVPYLVIAGLFLAVATLIFLAHLPEVREEGETKENVSAGTGLCGLWPYKHLQKGVLAQFCYVGAQVGIASFIIRFAQYSVAGMPEKHAADFLKLHLLGFMLGRSAGSAIMKHIRRGCFLSSEPRL
jgi:FHS family L-fucose permease-like MFS transporter